MEGTEVAPKTGPGNRLFPRRLTETELSKKKVACFTLRKAGA
jgi:hypothetical protein